MLPRTQRTRYITRLPLAESVNGWPHRGLPAHLHDRMPDLLATPPPLSDRVLTSIFPSPPDALCFLHFLFFADRRVGKTVHMLTTCTNRQCREKDVGVRAKPVVTRGALRPATEKRAALRLPKHKDGAQRPLPSHIDIAQTCGVLRPPCTHMHVYASV